MFRFSAPALTALLLATASNTNALVPQQSSASASASVQNNEVIGRRGVFGILGAGAAVAMMVPDAQASAAKTGIASPFTGDYDDPNHPGCLRQVKVVGAPLKGDGTRSAFPIIEVTGYDGKGEGAAMCTERPTRGDLWKVTGSVKDSNTAVIDFSPKGGPAKLVGKFEDGGIVFPDGNKWTKIPYTINDRRPADMSTLKSD